MKPPLPLAFVIVFLFLGAGLALGQGPRVAPGKAGQPSLTAPTAAQISALAAERAKLLAGVRTIPRQGVPGPVVAYGPTSFPLLAVPGDKPLDAVAAAGTLGKGRAVIFGHTGYLNGGSDQGDLNRLLLNSIRWCGGKDKPRVGLKGAKTTSLLEENGLRGEVIGAFDLKSLNDCDVLIASAQDLTDVAEADALRTFIERGGGFIGAVTGWAFVQTSRGKDFGTEHLGNRVLAEAGLAWTDETLAEGALEAPSGFPVALHAWTALAALAPKPGGAAPDTAFLNSAARTIQLALSSMPAANRPAYQRVLGRVLERDSKAPIPSPEKPLANADARALASLDARLTAFLLPAETKAHPAAANFPGRPGAQARAITRTVSVDPSVPGWRSTGLYADAGARIHVTCPAASLGKGYALRIGCHTDRLYKLDSWKRMPELSTLTPIRAAETEAANPFGGLIYLVVPENAAAEAPFDVSIAGGIEAPLFEHGKTSDSQWQQMTRSAAPWAELACKGVILTVPTAVAREVRHPDEVMTYWQRVIDAEDELANVAGQRKRPERIVPDVQISAGFMHSGYPIMIHLPQAKEMVTVSDREKPGWGFYHEIGHNHQRPEWTFEGTVEVTCNLFSLYIFEAVIGKDKTTGHGQVSKKAQEEHWEKHHKAGAPFEAWKADPFLALTSYIQLIDGFGFDCLKQVLRSYQGDELGPLPKTDDEKRDQWMVRYSKISGKNLGPFFDAWGIPVSSQAKAQIGSLPSWMPSNS